MTFPRNVSSITVIALSLAACADQPAPAPGADQAPAAAADSIPPSLPPSPVLLEAEALRDPGAAADSTALLRFGVSKAESMAFLQRVLGKAPQQEGENADCAATYATWDNGLTVYFQNDRLAGWSVRTNEVRTASGIGIGVARAQVEAAHDTKVSESSIGTEFNAEGIAGTFDPAQPNGAITHMWAGVACIAR
jgi:hypothetical protein